MRLIDGRWRQVGVHEGTDVFAEPGTPVRAVVPGVVEQAGWTFYSGTRVGVRGVENVGAILKRLKGSDIADQACTRRLDDVEPAHVRQG